jgi:Domain of unknown function (DUF4157)
MGAAVSHQARTANAAAPPRAAQAAAHTPAKATSALARALAWSSPVAGIIVQRACACGGANEDEEEPLARSADASGAISSPDDPSEIEAERVANQVMRMTDDGGGPPRISARPFTSIGRASTVLNAGGSGANVGSIVAGGTSSGGRSLDPGTRSLMESRFGRDFGHVRVHTGADAAHSAQALHALAYTTGHHIVFGHGRYAPASDEGQHLLAHELTHTVQQDRGTTGALVQRTPDTWYRGQAPGVGPAVPEGFVHDFGDGLYLTNDPAVAAQYAATRGAETGATGTGEVLSATFERAMLGRVLDLTQDARWAALMRTPAPGVGNYEGLIRLANENYWRFFEQFLRANGLSLESFDTIIGPEYVRGGNQACIRNPALQNQIRGLLRPGPAAPAGEVPPTEFRVGTEYRVISTEAIPGGDTISTIEVTLGEGLEALNRGIIANGGPPVPATITLRVTTDAQGALVAAESTTAEAASLAETLARQALATAPRAAAGGADSSAAAGLAGDAAAGTEGGVSPWVRGAGWAGIVLFLGVTIYRVGTAAPQDRPRVVTQSAGGFAGGFVSSYLVCNLALGIETVGWSLLICGFLAGIPGALAGEAVADVAYDEATIDDDAIRTWVSAHDLASLGRLPYIVKLRLIFSLMHGWISDEDVAAMTRLLGSVTSQSEMDRMNRAIEPTLHHMTSIGQRTTVRVALARRL